jgi:CheY-like chemotaxis protein
VTNTDPLLEPPSTPARAKLLLVDDTYANLVALTAVLEPLGQDLVTARSGEEALRRLLDADFAVILLDVHMPGMDGFQTATVIRRRERCRHTPIIFLTAHLGQPRHVFEGYSHGAVDYLVKPYDPDALRTKVRVLVDLYLARERVRREAEHARRHERIDLERASSARLQTWIDAVPHPIVVTRTDGSIEWANASWRATMGRDHDVTRTMGWSLGLAGGVAFELRHRCTHVDGGVCTYTFTCVPEFDDARRPVRWICTATAIADTRVEPTNTAESSLRTAETLPSLRIADDRADEPAAERIAR